jgi:signal transduction histidine kinase
MDALPPDRHVEFVHVPVANAGTVLKQARVYGGVVTVAEPQELEQLLAFGADETLDVGVASESTLRSAVQSARARAAARLEVLHAAARDDNTPDGAGLALLAGAVGVHMNQSLAAALHTCSVLERRCLEREACPPTSTDDGEVDRTSAVERVALADLRRRLNTVVDLAKSLVALATPGTLGMCNASEIALEVADLVRREVERVARFEVSVPNHSCIIPIGRATALNVLSSLLRNAMEVFDKPLRPDSGSIRLRVNVEADLVVLEVSDSGGVFDPEQRRGALDPTTTVHRAGALGLGLAIAADQVRRAGGDMLIDSDPDLGTTVRVFFPASSTVLRSDDRPAPVS